MLPTLLNPQQYKLGGVYADCAPLTTKPSAGATACIPRRKNAGLWQKGHPRYWGGADDTEEGLAHWKNIGVSPLFAGGDSDVAAHAVDGRQN